MTHDDQINIIVNVTNFYLFSAVFFKPFNEKFTKSRDYKSPTKP